MDIVAKLNKLSELRDSKIAILAKKQELSDSVLTEEVKNQLADIEAEFMTPISLADEEIAALEAEIKKDVIAHGQTVKGENLQAIYVKGRVSWDTDKLDGMIALIPALGTARSTGEPTVTYRKIGKVSK